MSEEAKGQAQGQNQQPEELSYDEQRANLYKEYDTPSEFLKGGHAEEVPDTEEHTEESADEGSAGEKWDGSGSRQEPTPEGEQAQGQKSEPEQRHKLAYGGNEYNLTDLEMSQLAQRGLEYSAIQSRLMPYAKTIQAIESDQNLAKLVVDTINGYMRGDRSGTPVVDPNAEPEIGDNEDWDDYEKRLNEWKEAKSQKIIDDRVAQNMAAMQERARQEQVLQANQKIIDYARADPEGQKVLAVIADSNFPAGLRQQMDYDGALFMSMYDTIRRNMGMTPYFGAPAMGAPAAQQQQPKPKEQSRAPFAESGRAANPNSRGGVASETLPDFKTMSDDEFRRFKDSVLHQGY